MENNRPIRVAITHGDTNGIGYEVIFKTFEDAEMLELCTPIIYGSPKVAAYHRKMLDLQANFSIINNAEDAKDGRINLLTTFEDDVKVEAGQPSKEAGQAALKALDRAMTDYRSELYDVLVTAPINKSTIQDDTFHFCGHTEYIENCVGDGKKALMILMNEGLRVALVTTHLPISQVASAITKDAIVEKATIFFDSLKRDFRISNPRIAVLALNPHAGDNGLVGNEEAEVITPAIQELEEKGLQAFGPYPADGFFGSHIVHRHSFRRKLLILLPCVQNVSVRCSFLCYGTGCFFSLYTPHLPVPARGCTVHRPDISRHKCFSLFSQMHLKPAEQKGLDNCSQVFGDKQFLILSHIP